MGQAQTRGAGACSPRARSANGVARTSEARKLLKPCNPAACLVRGLAVGILLQPAGRHLAQGQARRGARLGLQDAQRLALATQDLQALGRVAGGDDDLVEHAGLAVGGAAELADLAGQLLVHGPAKAGQKLASVRGQLRGQELTSPDGDSRASRGSGIGERRAVVRWHAAHAPDRARVAGLPCAGPRIPPTC